MSDNKNVNQDKGLQGNEKIEQAIAALQQEATQEMLAHTLTVIRRRMRENGQFILSVEPPTGDNQLRIGTVKTGDGKVWWAAFTSFEEELKGGGSVQSTFLTDIDQLFHSALQVNEIEAFHQKYVHFQQPLCNIQFLDTIEDVQNLFDTSYEYSTNQKF